MIDAYVTLVQTAIDPGAEIRLRDLPVKSHERLFFERVPLPPDARGRLAVTNPEQYSCVAEGVEAWGFRAMQGRGEFLSRPEVAEAWLRDEYLPVIEMLHEADLVGERTELEAYEQVADMRWRLLRTHEWDEEVIAELKKRLR